MIPRDPAAADGQTCDLVIVGGGIQGIAVALEAGRRGMRPVLLERDDFGARTSWNSLRIVHGGLRYLQTFDTSRFRESVGERRWFLSSFPELVRPLPCLMPLYGLGLHRPAILKSALVVNDLLSWSRNEGVRPDRVLSPGRVLSVADTLQGFPGARREGLRGAALWHDAVMADSQRVLLAMLHWAVARGAIALNYVAVESLVVSGARVAGVQARDRLTGRSLIIRSPRVVLCAGPWNACLAERVSSGPRQQMPMLMAFNIFLDRKPDFDVAIAVSPQHRGGRTYFLYPSDGGVLAGTHQSPWSGGAEAGPPSAELVDGFLGDIRSAIPDFEVAREDVLRVYWGLLPARAEGTDLLTKRPVIRRHDRVGGPSGLYSVTAIKFTTARRVAERLLGAIHRDEGRRLPAPDQSKPGPVPQPPGAADFRRLMGEDPSEVVAVARELLRTESVVCLDDLILRRTGWGHRPLDARAAERLLRQDSMLSGIPATAAAIAP